MKIFLDIRTYGVIQLNEECGFIQWVPDTIPMRSFIVKTYDARSIQLYVCLSRKHTGNKTNFASFELWQGNQLNGAYSRLKLAKDQEAVQIFQKEVLKQFVNQLHYPCNPRN